MYIRSLDRCGSKDYAPPIVSRDIPRGRSRVSNAPSLAHIAVCLTVFRGQVGITNIWEPPMSFYRNLMKRAGVCYVMLPQHGIQCLQVTVFKCSCSVYIIAECWPVIWYATAHSFEFRKSFTFLSNVTTCPIYAFVSSLHVDTRYMLLSLNS